MANDSARWQFATTTIYHFFVPVTIGLAFLVAILQTVWYRTDNPDYKRMTRFFGTLLLINVAIGVVTGLVQEFQFGMNWSTYSRFVGGVFGAPLAMEGILAFFLESTFLGLWLFGWDRLPKRVHLACIWAVSGSTMLSAMFILVANSWMQHPVGYKINSQGQAVLSNIWALLVNPTFVWGYAHVILASFVTGCLVMLAVSAWYLRKGEHVDSFHRTAKVALIVLIPTIIIQLSVGNQLGVIETKYQPMKIAAAEALWTTPAVLVLGGSDRGLQQQRRDSDEDHPHPASALGAGYRHLERSGHGAQPTPSAVPEEVRTRKLRTERSDPVLVDARHGRPRDAGHAVRAVGRLAAAEGPAAEIPIVPGVIGVGGDHTILDEHCWLALDRERTAAVDRPGAAEDRETANSPSVSATEIWISLAVFVLSYIVLAWADLVLELRYSRRGMAQADAEAAEPAAGAVPAMTY